jgi:hypothetical protein
MTEERARSVANAVMIAGAVGAAYYVLRTPPLRRAAWRLTRTWMRGPLAVWAVTEVRRAWMESASSGARAGSLAR